VAASKIARIKKEQTGKRRSNASMKFLSKSEKSEIREIGNQRNQNSESRERKRK
jgi:hypothetical protein